jgi:hypothetical protein
MTLPLIDQMVGAVKLDGILARSFFFIEDGGNGKKEAPSGG